MLLFFNNTIERSGLVGVIVGCILGILAILTDVATAGPAKQLQEAAQVGPSTDLPEDHTGFAVAVDDKGNVFLAGTSNSQWGAPVRSYAGGAGDCFVAKMNDQGFLLWNTFLGSSLSDGCRAIALDADGNVYVTGESGFISRAEPLRSHGGGSNDGFVAKLDGKGVLQWHTYLGGVFNDGGYALAVDRNRNVYVAGNSVDTWGEPVNQHSGSTHDGFAARLDKNGQLQWNTFFGGEDYDGSYAIALDEKGNVYVAGESFSSWGSPVNIFMRGYYGEYDAFVIKLDKNGVRQWNTFLGGTGSDYGRGIAVDLTSNVYVTGDSTTSWGKPLLAHHGASDAFVAKLDGNGILQWNTFLGGEGDDYSRCVTAPWTGNIFLTGQSSNSWGKSLNQFSGESDIFAAKIDTEGNLQWNTFLGGAGSDFGRSITMDGIGNVYLTGESSTPWGGSGETFQGEMKPFAAKLNNSGHLRWKIFLGER